MEHYTGNFGGNLIVIKEVIVDQNCLLPLTKQLKVKNQYHIKMKVYYT